MNDFRSSNRREVCDHAVGGAVVLGAKNVLNTTRKNYDTLKSSSLDWLHLKNTCKYLTNFYIANYFGKVC